MPSSTYNVGGEDWFNSREGQLFDDLIGDIDPAYEDRMAQALYHGAYYDQSILTPERIGFRDALKDYMWNEYGIDFSAEFDWEGWREAMGYDII